MIGRIQLFVVRNGIDSLDAVLFFRVDTTIPDDGIGVPRADAWCRCHAGRTVVRLVQAGEPLESVRARVRIRGLGVRGL